MATHSSKSSWYKWTSGVSVGLTYVLSDWRMQEGEKQLQYIIIRPLIRPLKRSDAFHRLLTSYHVFPISRLGPN